MGRLGLALTLLVLAVSSTSAFAQVRVSLGGALDLSQYDYTGTPSTKGGMGYGGFLLFDVPSRSKKFSIETGAFYLKRTFTDTDSGGTDTVRSVDSVMVPLTGWLNSGRFSLGAGTYYNKVLKYDGYFGVQGQVRLTFGKKAVKWFVGAQYLQGLQEDQVGVSHADVLLTLGFRFGGR